MMTTEPFEFDKVIWPCQTCGSDHAPYFKVNDKDFKVIGCSNCGLPKQDKHIESDLCWCKPVLVYSGNVEHWSHNRLQ